MRRRYAQSRGGTGGGGGRHVAQIRYVAKPQAAMARHGGVVLPPFGTRPARCSCRACWPRDRGVDRRSSRRGGEGLALPAGARGARPRDHSHIECLQHVLRQLQAGAHAAREQCLMRPTGGACRQPEHAGSDETQTADGRDGQSIRAVYTDGDSEWSRMEWSGTVAMGHVEAERSGRDETRTRAGTGPRALQA